MDAKDYVLRQVAFQRRLTDAALGDLTEEQLNWMPPGATNRIGIILLHMIGHEDNSTHAILQGKPTIWATGGWAQKLGVPAAPARGQGWDEVRDAPLALAPLLDYLQQVRAATDAYLAGVTPEELDRIVQIAGQDRPVAQVFVLLVVHSAAHTGEISALKGVSGAKGLPF